MLGYEKKRLYYFDGCFGGVAGGVCAEGGDGGG